MNLEQMKAAYRAAVDKMASIRSKAGNEFDLMKADELTGTIEERSAAFDKLLDEAETLKTQMEDAEKREQRSASIAQEAQTRATARPNMLDVPVHQTETRGLSVPANIRKYGALKAFRGSNADAQAYAFGMWSLAAMTRGGYKPAMDYLGNHGIALTKSNNDVEERALTMGEGVNSLGGFLVPTEFQNDLIDLREQYGVVRGLAKIVPMKSDSRTDPIRKGGVTAYWNGESAAATQSTKDWDRVTLTAKKLTALTKYSSELNEDAILNIGDDLAGEIAYAFALAEDQAALTGDGTSTYGKIIGVAKAITDVSSNAGLISGTAGTDASWASFTMTDFENMIAALPVYADAEAVWVCHKTFWAKVMQRLAIANAGNTIQMIQNGSRELMFLGYRIVLSQVMPSAAAASAVPCYLGNFRLGVNFGERRATTIAFSDSALNAFEQDEIVIRGTERVDINVHSPGTSTAAGPIVALQSHS